LIVSGHLKRKGFAVLKGWATVEPQAGDAHDCELKRQYVAFFPIRVVARCAVNRNH